MTPTEAYELGLYDQGRGLPLWEPDFTDITPGDVGLMKDGHFVRLFNATLPSTHPKQILGVPDTFQLMEVSPHLQTLPRPYLPPQILHSNTVKQYDITAEVTAGTTIPIGAGFRFTSSNKLGAVLVLKRGATCEDIYDCRRFRDYIEAHIDSWYDFADHLGYGPVPEGSIFMVRGCDKAAEWALAAFQNKTGGAELFFNGAYVMNPAGVRVSVQGSWGHYTSGQHRCGPLADFGLASLPSMERSHLTGADSALPFNQPVFLRIWRVRRGPIKLLSRVKAAAEPQDDNADSDQERDIDPCGTAEGTSDDAIVVEPDPKSDPGPHPLDVLLEYILEHSAAHIAIATDDDLYNLFEGGPIPEITTSVLQRIEKPLAPIYIDEEQNIPGLQPLRRKATPGQSPARDALYSRSVSHRNSRTSLGSDSSRRVSLPAIHLHVPATVATAAGAMAPSPLPPPAEDPYPNLSKFTFGAVDISSHGAPRPSFSGGRSPQWRTMRDNNDENSENDPESKHASSESEPEYAASDVDVDTDVELDLDTDVELDIQLGPELGHQEGMSIKSTVFALAPSIHAATQAPAAAAVYEGWDFDFIPDSAGQRRASTGFESRASASTARDGRGLLSGFGLTSWGRDAAATSRSSGSNDAFIKHIQEQDPIYKARAAEWSFTKEKAEGDRDLMRMTSSATRASDARGKAVVIGLQEIWRCEYIGRFKVDRVTCPPEEAGRPQQQRLNVHHILDPYSKGNTRGGPSGLIHKHARAVAFSIFRKHDMRNIRRGGSSQMSMGMGVLLAPKRVQEQYTSTKTKSKLNDRDLLSERLGRTSASSSVRPRSSWSTASQREEDRKDKGKGKGKGKGKEKERQSPPPSDSEAWPFRETTYSLSSHILPVSASTRQQSLPMSSPSFSTFTSTLATHNTRSPEPEPEPVSPTSSQEEPFDYSMPSPQVPPGVVAAHAAGRLVAVGAGSSFLTLERKDLTNLDDEPLMQQTSDKEAYGTLNAEVLEQTHTFGHNREGFILNQMLRMMRDAPRGPPHALEPITSEYEPPWLATGSRKDVENQERTIARLDGSFKDVGLLPTLDPKQKGEPPKRKDGRADGRRNEDVFKPVPDDALFMLLPLWPKETEPALGEDAGRYEIPLEQRQFLLVYYRREEGKKSKKKRTRDGAARPSGGGGSMGTDVPDDPSQLRTFHVCARMLGYSQLRHCGVRCPSHGLSVTGALRDAFAAIPPATVRERERDPAVIAVWHSRETGLELVTKSLDKLGLCQPRTADLNLDEDDAPPLTAIGCAAVEMVWLGAMALTSFGPI